MQARKTTRRLATFVLALGVAAAGTVPEAQAHHAPGEGTAAPRSVTQPPPRIITVTKEHGFDFGAAGIGAGGAIGVVLVAGGSALLKRRITAEYSRAGRRYNR